MTTARHTKRALLASVLSLLLCASMLVGTTFAWFTDNDTVTMSNIVSGTLDIEIVDATGAKKDGALKFLNQNGSADILWEPGVTFNTEHFAIKNFGNLNLKYKLEINNTEVSYNKLNDVIDFYLVDAATGDEIDLSTMVDLWLAPNTSSPNFYIKGVMAADADNAFQGLTLSGVSITVYAAQISAEFDANGNDYDKDAIYDDEIITVGTADAFIEAFATLEAGEIVTLTADIDMTGKSWTPVNNKSYTLNGNGFTITGLNGGMTDHTGSASITIKNITFDGLVDNSATNYAGLIADADTCDYIEMNNVTIINANISSAKYVGGFTAYTTGYGNDYNGPVYALHNFINCSLIDSTITGGGSTGGLIGHAGGDKATTTTINGFTATGNTITGEDAAHTGILIGTAGVGEVFLDYTESAVQSGAIIGRFVPGGVGKLVINGVEKSAFANQSVSSDDVATNGGLDGGSIDSTVNIGNGLTVSTDGLTIQNATIVADNPGGHVIKITADDSKVSNVVIENDTNATTLWVANTNNTTVSGSNITGAYKAIEVYENTELIKVEDCTLDAIYPINVNSSDPNTKLVVENSTLKGWTSYGNIHSATFTGVTFGAGHGYAYLRPYADTTLTDCIFEAGFGMGFGTTNDRTITLTNCTYGGTPLTADNIIGLLIQTNDSPDYGYMKDHLTLIVNGTTVVYP